MVRKKSIDILSRKTSYDIWIGENLLKKKNKDLKFILANKNNFDLFFDESLMVAFPFQSLLLRV